MNEERVCELVKQLVALQEELKEKRAMLDYLKEELDKAMANEPVAETPYGTVKLYAYDTNRLAKEKIKSLVEESQNKPISNIELIDLTNISDVHYYRIIPKVE